MLARLFKLLLCANFWLVVQVSLSFPLHPSLQRAYDEVLLDGWINVRA